MKVWRSDGRMGFHSATHWHWIGRTRANELTKAIWCAGRVRRFPTEQSTMGMKNEGCTMIGT